MLKSMIAIAIAGMLPFRMADSDSATGDYDPSLFLDGTLDDLEDLPGFSQWPSGCYRVRLPEGLVLKDGLQGRKKMGDHPGVAMNMECLEVMELANAEKDAHESPKPKDGDTKGDQCGIGFMLDNETGRGFLKEVMKVIGEALQINSNAEIMANSKGLEAVVVVTRTHDDKKNRDYTNLKRFALV